MAAGEENGIGMQLTSVPYENAVVNHHSGMHHAVRADTTSSADTDPGTDRGACTHHSPLINHSRWMDPCRRPAAWNQLIQSFRKRQARVREHCKGNIALTCRIDQVLLVREQKSTRTALPNL